MNNKVIHYEYAGFMYYILPTPAGYEVTPAPGQHSAANKDKHCTAALQCWLDDGEPQ